MPVPGQSADATKTVRPSVSDVSAFAVRLPRLRHHTASLGQITSSLLAVRLPVSPSKMLAVALVVAAELASRRRAEHIASPSAPVAA